VIAAIHILSQLIAFKDEEILIEACWALSYLGQDDIKVLVETPNVVQRLCGLLHHERVRVVSSALKVVVNIARDDLHADKLLNAGILSELAGVLSRLAEIRPHRTIKGILKEACWVISKINSGTSEQVQKVLECPGLMDSMVDLLSSTEDLVAKEAAFAVLALISHASKRQISVIASDKCISELCGMLKRATQAKIQPELTSLEALNHILNSAKLEAHNPYVPMLTKHGGLDAIKSLQKQANLSLQRICQIALILQHF
jgi:importin subunit alpha-1